MTASVRSWSDLPIYSAGRRLLGPTQALLNDPLTFHIEPYRHLGPLYRFRHVTTMTLVMAGTAANDFVWHNSELWSYNQRMKCFREGFDDTCLLQLDGEPHQKKKRHFLHGFKHADLIRHIPAMSQVLAQALATLPDGRHDDLRQLCKRLTVAMTCQSMLQLPLPPELDTKIDSFSDQLLFGDSLGILRHLWYRRPSYQRLRQDLIATIQHMLDLRAANPPAEDDILSLMLKAHLPDEPAITRQELALDILFLLQGGTETASQLIVWSLMYIYQHPEWLAALREELQSWSPERFTNMNDWPKLKATILEVERLRPPVPYFILLPTRDFEYEGVQVPKGTPVFHAAALPHFLSEIFEEPLVFNPQRFLGDSRQLLRVQATFGGGRHFCPGLPLAHLKLPIAIAHILTTYDLIFERPLSFRPELGIVIAPDSAVPIRLVPRGCGS